MEPNQHEAESKRVSKHIVYLSKQLKTVPPEYVVEAANSFYGNVSKVHELTALLCKLCQEASDEIIYNGKDPTARKLADWWDAHQAADKIKAKQAKAKKIQAEIRQTALDKLSEAERKALGF